MNILIPDAMAQAAGAAPNPNQQFFPIIMLVVFVGIFYFMLIRPQQKKQKEHQNMLSGLSTGDEVVTAGGILGRITEVGDNFVTVEVADGVRLKVQKFQITQLMPKGTIKGA